MNRRQFLTGAGVIGASTVVGSLAACSSPGPTTSSHGGPTTSAVTPTSTATSGDFDTLGRAMDGSLVLPSDPAYSTAKLLYNEKFDNMSPAAVAYCQTNSDVQRCLAFARHHGLVLAPRSGGHSYGGYSSCDGIVLDVSRMNGVTLAPGSQHAVVGAGAKLIDIYNTLGGQGVLLPGGSCPTVGIAGLTMGGGVGVFGRKYGLTCDQLRGATLVSADGSLHHIEATNDTDLLWALQGGGGGNFGIVTSFDFTVHAIPPIVLFTLTWPWAAAGDVLAAWQHWSPNTVDELWSNCQLLSAGSSGLEVRVPGVFAGSVAACSAALQPLLSAVGSPPLTRYIGSDSYLSAMLAEGGCEGSTVAQCHLPSQNPAGTLTRSSFSAKSAYINTVMPESGITSAVGAVASLNHEVPVVGGGMVFDGYGGAIGRPAPTSTAFVHRDAIAAIQYDVNWSSGAEQSVIDDANAWLVETQSTLAPYSKGSYVNYIDPTLVDWQTAYYGQNLDRLVSVKRSIDPDDVFHFAQSIPLSLAR